MKSVRLTGAAARLQKSSPYGELSRQTATVAVPSAGCAELAGSFPKTWEELPHLWRVVPANGESCCTCDGVRQKLARAAISGRRIGLCFY